MKRTILLSIFIVLIGTSLVMGQTALQWNLQEGTGLTTADELGNMGGALTDLAHAGWQAYPSGEKGILFDNMTTEKTILVSNDLVTFGQQFTFEAWVKINAIDTSKQSSILYLEKKIWNAPKKEQMRGGVKVLKGSDDNHVAVKSFLGFGYDDGTEGGAMEWVNMDSDTELEIGVWAHLALVRDGNYVSLNINGYEVASASQELVPEIQAQVGWVVLGCNKDMDGGTTNMEVARSAVTPRALNSDNFILAPTVPNFDMTTSALQWNLQEGTGLTAADELGNMGGALTDLAHAGWQAYPSGENGLLFDNMTTEKTILVSNDLVTFGQQFTFEAWVKVNAIDTSKQSSIMYLEKKIWNAPKKEQMRGGIKVLKGSDDNHVAVTSFLGFGYDDGTEAGAMEWVNMDSDTELEIGVWAHLALVRDGNYVSVNINGYEVGSASQELVPEAQAQVGWVVLGCNKDMDGGTTNMEVARSAVTPRALNSDNFILAPTVPNFDMTTSALQWNLQEGTGLTTADELGNMGGALTDLAHAGWQAYPSGEKGILFDNMTTEKTILVSNDLVTFGQQFTFEAWVKVNAIDTSKQSSIMYLEKKIWNAPKKEQMRGGVKVLKGSDDNHVAVKSFLGFGYDDGTEAGAMEWVNMDSDTELEIGVWAHLALVRDGNYVSVNINGYEVASASQELVPEIQAQVGWVVLGCNKDMDGGTTNMEVARSAITPRALNSDNFILAPIVPNFDVGTDVESQQIAGNLPTDYSLQQNYPNPFNPTTTIQYKIPSMTNVTLVIYNLQGQLIKTLVNSQTQAPGNYSVVWDGKNSDGNTVSTGLYIYQLKTSGYTYNKKMLLTK